MATGIPNQNDLSKIIQSQIDDAMNIVNVALDKMKAAHIDPRRDVKKELEWLSKNNEFVEKFVKDFSDFEDKVKNSVDKVANILGTPKSINKIFGDIKVEIINGNPLKKSIEELQKLLNTPAEINSALQMNVPKLRRGDLKQVVERIKYILELPGKINKELANIKVEEIDTTAIEKSIKQYETLFGKKGLFTKFDAAIKQVNKFKGINLFAVINIWWSVRMLRYIQHQVVKYGRGSIEAKNAMKASMSSLVMMQKFLKSIADTVKSYDNVSLIGLLVLPIKIRLMRIVLRMIEALAIRAGKMGPILAIMKGLNLSVLKSTVETIVGIIEQVNGVSIKDAITARIKIRLITAAANSILNRLRGFLLDPDMLIIMVMGGICIAAMKAIKNVLAEIAKILETVNKFSIKDLIIARIKIKMIGRFIHRIENLFMRLLPVALMGLILAPIIIPGLGAVLLIVFMYKLIIVTIKSIKMGLMFRFKVKRMINATALIKKLIRRIVRLSRTRGVRKAMVNLVLMTMLIYAFANVVIALILLTPIMAIFLVLAPIIILVMIGFMLVFKIIIFVISRMISVKSIVVIVLLTGMVAMLVLLGLGLVLLAMLAGKIVENALNILLFIGIVGLVALGLGLLGMLLGWALPFMFVAIMGIVVVVIAVVALLIIAASLWLLSKIELDEEKIKENVRKVIDTVFAIMACLFEDDIDDPEGKDSWFTKIIKLIGGAAMKLIMALAAAAILAATVVTVFCILLIAGMLWLLSKIELDQGAIMTNIDNIFDTVDQIMNRLFEQDEKETERSKNSILMTVVNWISPEIGKLVRALLGAAYLFMIFISVGLILAIAGMLRLLQMLDLQEDQIMAKVDTVFNITDRIISRIFGDRKDDEHKSNRGILITIISWVDEGLAKIVEAALAVVYLALALLAITLILAIAGMLRLLEEINLDETIISEKVDTVFNTVDQIISRIFNDRDDTEHPSNRGILITIISWVDEGLAKIYEAALSIVYLALIMVAITIVIGIAGLLKGLQDIDINGDQIMERVNAVFDTADLILQRVFAHKTDDSQPSSNSALMTIIGWFNPELSSILSALMAIIQLALIFAAISIVVGIAKQLEFIQSIDINADQVVAKVKSIFAAAREIMKEVYAASDDLLPEPKDQDLFGSLISFFTPNLGKVLDALKRIAMLSVVFAAISAVKGIGESLDGINKLDINIKDATQRVSDIIDAAAMICSRVLGAEPDIKLPEPPPEKKSIFGALTDFFFGGESKADRQLKEAMKKIEILSVICSALGALKNIQDAIKQINEVEFDQFDSALSRIDSIIAASAHIAESIFGANVKFTLPEPSEDETIAALIDMGYGYWAKHNSALKSEAKNEAAMKLAMQRIQILSLVASSVGSLVTIIEGIDKIKDYEVPDPTSVKKQVQAVMSAAAEIAFTIFNQDGIGMVGGNAAGISKQIEDIKARVDFITSATTGVTTVCQGLQDFLSAVTFTEEQVIKSKQTLSTGVDSVGQILKQMDELELQPGYKERIDERNQLLREISETVGSFVKVTDKDVKNSKNITENYIKFMKQVDSMDLKKLQHTDWLMRSWASISHDLQGNFEGLARTINQHVMPVLDKLNKTMDEVKKCQEKIIDDLTKPVDLNGGGSATSMVGVDGNDTGVPQTEAGKEGAGNGTANSGLITSGDTGNKDITKSSTQHQYKSSPKNQLGIYEDVPEGTATIGGVKYIIKKK